MDEARAARRASHHPVQLELPEFYVALVVCEEAQCVFHGRNRQDVSGLVPCGVAA